MNEARVTIAEVARVAGVSKATVSLVLNERSTSVAISDTTKATVRAVAERLGYIPNEAARALRGRRTGVITMIVANVSNPFYLDIASAAAAATSRRDHQLILIDGSHTASKLEALSRLRGRGSDGLIIATGYHSTHGTELEAIRDLVSRSVPVVLILDSSPDPSVSAIRIDNAHAAYLGARHLLQLGHRRIANLGLEGTEPLVDVGSTQAERYRGYKQAVAEFDLAPNPEWLVQASAPTLATGRESMLRLLQAPGPRPTAVLAFNDLMGMGALRACFELGVRVPDEMAIVGFGGIEAGQFTSPSLTTVDFPRHELGQAAVTRLLDQLDGAALPETEEILPVQLVIRESCGAALRS